MTDTTSAGGLTAVTTALSGGAPSTKTGSVAGSVASGSISTALSVLIQTYGQRHGMEISDSEANAMVPLLIVVLHPIGMMVNAVVDRLVRWLSK